MDYPEIKSRYLLLPDADDDYNCVMIDVCHIRQIEKLEAEDFESVDEDGNVVEGHNGERCLLTYSPESKYVKNWEDKAKTIRVELSLYELLKLINSDAEYHIKGKD